MKFIFVIFVTFFFFQCSQKQLVKKSSFTKPEITFGEIKKINLKEKKVFITFSIFIKNNSRHNLRTKLRDLTAYDEERKIIGIIQQVNKIHHFPKGIKKEILLRLTIEKRLLLQKSKEFFFNNQIYIFIEGNLSIILPFIILDYPLSKEYRLQLFK